MILKYERRLKLTSNRSAYFAIPKAVAQAWEAAGFDRIDVLYDDDDGEIMVLKPRRAS